MSQTTPGGSAHTIQTDKEFQSSHDRAQDHDQKASQQGRLVREISSMATRSLWQAETLFKAIMREAGTDEQVGTLAEIGRNLAQDAQQAISTEAASIQGVHS